MWTINQLPPKCVGLLAISLVGCPKARSYTGNMERPPSHSFKRLMVRDTTIDACLDGVSLWDREMDTNNNLSA